MRNLGIRYVGGGKEDAFMVEIICDCGERQLVNDKSGGASHLHKVVLGTTCRATPYFSVSCPACGRGYGVNPQREQFWVNEIRGPRESPAK